eukprot:Nitzschia sp. Nitz4//scaffold135_size62275//61771//62190//NITZ4_006358-RA/size62275-snap-gene-0.61-mRNA-1//-1//CDS//3329535587//8369//frame0
MKLYQTFLVVLLSVYSHVVSADHPQPRANVASLERDHGYGGFGMPSLDYSWMEDELESRVRDQSRTSQRLLRRKHHVGSGHSTASTLGTFRRRRQTEPKRGPSRKRANFGRRRI